MSTQVQFRRGTTADISTFIGADGEVVVDTTKKTCVVNDGVQIAGYPLLREDGSNSALNVGSLSSCALKFINDPNTGIISPGADQIALVTGGASRLSVDSSGSVTIPGNLLVSGAFTGSITFDNGSAAVPALRFTNDPDTGIYLAGTNQVAISTGGTQRLTTTTTEVTSTLPVIHPLGAAATPSLTFTGDTNTGIYSPGADQVAISTNGTGRLFIDSTGQIEANSLGTAAAPVWTFLSDPNTGIYSPGADQVAISTNGAGRLFVDSSGRLGLGTSSPTQAGLVISTFGSDASTRAWLAIRNNSTAASYLRIGRYGSGSDSLMQITNNYNRDGGTFAADDATQGVNDVKFKADGSFSIATGAAGAASPTERLTILSGGNVGIGVTSPNNLLHVRAADVTEAWAANSSDAFKIEGSVHGINLTTSTTGFVAFSDADARAQGLIEYLHASDSMQFRTAGSERARIDSSGRLLVGTSSAQGTSIVQVCGSSTASTEPGDLRIIRGLGVSSIGANVGAGLGCIRFGTFEEAVGATIEAQSDATWSSTSDTPGRLVFSTTADGASSPTERMRITNAGTTTLTSAASTAPFIASIGASEVARIDSSGRLLVGTSSSQTIVGGASQIQINGANPLSGMRYGTTTGGPTVTIGSTRAASQGSFSIASSGDTLANLLFVGDDGTAFVGAARITAAVDGTPGANDMPGRLVFSTTADGSASPTERMRLDSNGRLLLGLTGAQQFNNFSSDIQMQIARGSNLNCNIQMTSFRDDQFGPGLLLGKSRSQTVGTNTIVQANDYLATFAGFGADGTNWVPAASIEIRVDGTPGLNDMPGRLVFSTTADGASSPTERMRITNSGAVLIGKQALSATTTGIEFEAVGFMRCVRDGDFASIFQRYSSNGDVVGFRRDNTPVGSISVTTTATAYNTSSDYRLKENVVPLTGAADRLNQLQVKRFNFIADPDKTVDGFIAHEAQAVVPECVTGTKDEVDNDGNPVYQGIDQSKLVPLLTAALQEALAEIESLKARVTALEP
jgi:hypothetical protein